MASKTRKTKTRKTKTPKTPQKAPGGRRTSSPAKQRSLRSLIDQVGADVRALGERIAACELRQEVMLVAAARATDDLHAREDDAQAAVYELQATIEPFRMAAKGASPEEIARHVAYLGLVAGVRRVVRNRVPRQARVLVVGRGDEELVRLFGRQAAHFPQDALGDFAAEHPADDASAIAALNSLVTAGWNHLVIPATSLWWLEHYREFRIHLHRSWHAIHRDMETCVIFAHDPVQPGPWQECDEFLAEFMRTESRSPAVLDWETGSELAAFFPRCAVFPPVDRGVDALPYLDRSIDIVAVPWGDSARRSEARRVASAAVVEIAMPGIVGPGFRIVIERLGRHATDADGTSAAAHLGRITPALRP